jgi:hypothetical protein
MEFHEYESEFKAAIAIMRTERGKFDAEQLRDAGWRDFYDRKLEYLMGLGTGNLFADSDTSLFVNCQRSRGEGNWYLFDRPYYKIWPDYVTMLAKTSLAVPVSEMRFPTPSFELRMPKGHEVRSGSVSVCSLLLSEIEMKAGPDAPVRGRLFLMTCNAVHAVGGAAEPYKYSVSLATSEELGAGATLEQYLVETMDRSVKLDGTADVDEGDFLDAIEQCWRIGLSVCFLATGGERWIDPDVLNKDFNAYLEAVNKKDQTAVGQFQRRATRARNQVGYTLGKAEALLGRRAWDVDTKTTKHSDGSPLKWRQIRNAHTHRYWVGSGADRRLEKRFIRMLIIRPDLPINPNDKGHRTLRSRKEMDGDDGQT